jgi:hypothetical protein
VGGAGRHAVARATGLAALPGVGPAATGFFSKNRVQPWPHHETHRSTEVGEISKYEELEAAFEAQLERTARFVPVAFHVHSPDSHDWGKEVALGADDPSNLEGEEMTVAIRQLHQGLREVY